MGFAVVEGMEGLGTGFAVPLLVVGYEVMILESLKLKYVPVLPMMRWSRIWISRSFESLMSVVVTYLPAVLGLVLSDGWLWTTMMAFALARRAPLLFGGRGCLLNRPGLAGLLSGVR